MIAVITVILALIGYCSYHKGWFCKKSNDDEQNKTPAAKIDTEHVNEKKAATADDAAADEEKAAPADTPAGDTEETDIFTELNSHLPAPAGGESDAAEILVERQ